MAGPDYSDSISGAGLPTRGAAQIDRSIRDRSAMYDVMLNTMKNMVCVLVVLACVTLLCSGQAVVSLLGSPTCQNVTLGADYDPNSPLVVCCLL